MPHSGAVRYWKRAFTASLVRVGWRLVLFFVGIITEVAILYACSSLDDLELIPDEIRELLFLPEFLIMQTIAIILIFKLSRRRADRLVEIEAERWIEDRHSVYRPSRFTRRAVRQVLWIPTLVAIPVLLFLPEFAGMWTQRNAPEQFTVSGHPLNIPRTWIVDWSEERSKDDYVTGLIIKGAFQGGPRRWQLAEPYGYVSFNAHGRSGEKDRKESSRDTTRIVINRELRITCQEWKPDKHFLSIDCESPNGELAASFIGRGEAAEWFYAALSTQPTTR